jgi:uncharacterized protein (DUF1810 family)
MAQTGDPYELERFVTAQDPVFARVLAELKQGRKTSHWMWFVFPQIAGLGSSAMAQRFAISSLAEARAYLDHPLLGSRLGQCVTILLDVEGRNAHDIFGSPDDMKFHSSLTLFSRAAPRESLFRTALDRYFSGRPDQATLDRL